MKRVLVVSVLFLPATAFAGFGTWWESGLVAQMLEALRHIMGLG